MGGKSIGDGGVRLALVTAGHGVSHPMCVPWYRTPCARCAFICPYKLDDYNTE